MYIRMMIDDEQFRKLCRRMYWILCANKSEERKIAENWYENVIS